MQMKKIRINGRDNIVKLAALIGLGVFIAQMLEMSTVASVLFACSLLCVTVNYWAFVSARNYLRLDDIVLLLVTLISIVLSEWQLNLDYFKPVIIVLCSIVCIDQCAEIEANKKTCKRIQLFLILVCILANALYYGGLRYKYHGSTRLVAMNFNNPNEAAMWLVFLIVLLFDSSVLQQGKVSKLLPWACACSLLPILYSTQSRNGLLAMLFYFAGKIVLRFLSLKKLPKWFVFLITVAPILVYVGYMYIIMPNYDRFAQWFSFLISRGKELSARRTIWSNFEMDQATNILFGNYTVYHTEQLHNSILTLYCRFGVFFVAIVCRKLYKTLKKMPNAAMQLALSTIWLTGCFETSIFVGIAGMYMLVLLLPIFHQPGVHPDKAVRT